MQDSKPRSQRYRSRKDKTPVDRPTIADSNLQPFSYHINPAIYESFVLNIVPICIHILTTAVPNPSFSLVIK